MNIGIIGPGMIAHRLADAVTYMPGVSVIAVASKNIDRAKAFAQQHSIALYYEDYSQMLKKAPIELVYIATTHNFHYANILMCLEYGKHVLCEKCMVLTQKQAEHVRKEAREKNLFVMEAMWSRFIPTVNQVKKWISSGNIGKIVTGHIQLGFLAPKDADSRLYNPHLAGGAMFDIGVYAIEIAMFLTGQKLIESRSILKYADTGVDVIDSIVLEFQNCIISLQMTFLANIPQQAFFCGTNGYIMMPTPSYGNTCYLYDNYGNLVDKFIEVNSNGLGTAINGSITQLNEVIRCIQNGQIESDIMPLAHTVECAKIFDRCLSGV